jgi:hypothetical protein
MCERKPLVKTETRIPEKGGEGDELVHRERLTYMYFGDVRVS